MEDRILAMDPNNVTQEQVLGVLAKAPAPRVLSFNGSVTVASMDSFSCFLVKMGYPASAVSDPGTGKLSYSSYTPSRQVAGMVAWCYERDGLRPMLIGHSQGGMLVVKSLYELAGDWQSELSVWNPQRQRFESRCAIRDPLTGKRVPVIGGAGVSYSAALATGRKMRVLMGQWNMISRLRAIPATTDEFAGFFVQGDLVGGDMGENDSRRYYSLGRSVVRNHLLPASYGHVSLPTMEPLAGESDARRWVSNYRPGPDGQISGPAPAGRNILLAAQLWHDVKKHWVLELQRLIQARRRNKP